MTLTTTTGNVTGLSKDDVAISISIIVPTYNEQAEIRGTLDRLIDLEWPSVEIIVVDDSTDDTPNIVLEYANRGVRLIRPPVREGRCGARNLGILESKGEVVIILNADVLLPRDFICKIAPKYIEGIDCLAVNALVENPKDLFARYTDCGHKKSIAEHPEAIGWSEGFSCRRDVAISAGMFPTGYPVPICAGEDGYFVDNLDRIGARRALDLSIVITHIAPGNLAGFWHQCKERGQGTPQAKHFLQGRPLMEVKIRALLRLFQTAAMIMLVVPLVIHAARLSRFTDNPLRELGLFIWASLVQKVGFHVGEWKGIRQIEGAMRAPVSQ